LDVEAKKLFEFDNSDFKNQLQPASKKIKKGDYSESD